MAKTASEFENRCARCNRKLKDPSAIFGWRCAQILGVDTHLNDAGDGAYKAFQQGVAKAYDELIQSGIDLDTIDAAGFVAAYAKMALAASMNNKSLWDAAHADLMTSLSPQGGKYTSPPLEYYFAQHDSADRRQGRYTKTKYLEDPLVANLFTYLLNQYQFLTPILLSEDQEEFGEHSETFQILVDLNNRWWLAEDSEKTRLKNVANEVRRLAREKTPIQYAQDKVMDQLHANAEQAIQYQRTMLEGFTGMLYQFSQGNFFVDNAAALIGMSYGAWDYKQIKEWQVPYRRFNGKDMEKDYNKNWNAWMYFDGMLMAGDDFGNLNMAYVGSKMGLSDIVYQNFLTTDGKDADWIKYGIHLAQSGR